MPGKGKNSRFLIISAAKANLFILLASFSPAVYSIVIGVASFIFKLYHKPYAQCQRRFAGYFPLLSFLNLLGGVSGEALTKKSSEYIINSVLEGIK